MQPLTISEIVRQDYRTADVFKKWGINYCCGGNLPLAEVCHLRSLDQERVENDLQQATQRIVLSNAVSFDEWPVDFLVDYIVHVHHDYVKKTLPHLTGHVQTFIEGHKKKHPDLEAVAIVFSHLSTQLIQHIEREEEIIFPYLKQIANTYKRNETYGSLFVRTLGKPLTSTTENGPQSITFLLADLRAATDHYQFAANACTNHQVIYHRLKEFDADLVQHKHLENNILYPKVQAMEKDLLQQ